MQSFQTISPQFLKNIPIPKSNAKYSMQAWVQSEYTCFFYKKLSSGNEYSVSYENGFFRVLSFFAVSYPTAIGAIFVQKYESFLEKSLDSFL